MQYLVVIQRRYTENTLLYCIAGLVTPPSAVFLCPDVGDIADINLILFGNRKLPMQLILEHRQLVVAVCRHLAFLLMPDSDGSLMHQLSRLLATNRPVPYQASDLKIDADTKTELPPPLEFSRYFITLGYH